jgi:hypothetical protein
MRSAFVFGAAIFFGTAAMAADLPKKGSYSTIYASFGTAKATRIGKDRMLIVFDENGLKVGQGVMDHTTWHCFGLSDIASGMVRHHGYCVATNPDGDQMVGDFASDDKYRADAKI